MESQTPLAAARASRGISVASGGVVSGTIVSSGGAAGRPPIPTPPSITWSHVMAYKIS